jgi:hypothetical protein
MTADNSPQTFNSLVVYALSVQQNFLTGMLISVDSSLRAGFSISDSVYGFIYSFVHANFTTRRKYHLSENKYKSQSGNV